MLELRGTRFQDSVTLPILPWLFYFLGLLSKIAREGGKKLIFIQTNTPACLFLNGDSVIFDRE